MTAKKRCRLDMVKGRNDSEAAPAALTVHYLRKRMKQWPHQAKTGHGHADSDFVISVQAHVAFSPASCRVSTASCKLLKELPMDKERYQTQVAEKLPHLCRLLIVR